MNKFYTFPLRNIPSPSQEPSVSPPLQAFAASVEQSDPDRPNRPSDIKCKSIRLSAPRLIKTSSESALCRSRLLFGSNMVPNHETKKSAPTAARGQAI